MGQRIIVGIAYMSAQALLLWYLMFQNKKYYCEVIRGDTHSEVFTSDIGQTNIHMSHRQKIESPQFRAAVIVICGTLAAAAGYQVTGKATTVYEIIKLGAALLGVSACMLTDLYIYLIPNKFIIYMCVSRGIIFLVELLSGRDDILNSLLNSLLGGSLSFLLLLMLSLATKQGIGMGDVKMMGAIGFLGGLYVTINTLVLGLLLCAVVGVCLLLKKRKKIRDKLPFAPFLYGGFVITLMLNAI